MSSCPSGSEMKSYIEFLRTYSQDHKHLSAVDALRKGIKEWQYAQLKVKRKQYPNEQIAANPLETTTRKSKRWYWIFVLVVPVFIIVIRRARSKS